MNNDEPDRYDLMYGHIEGPTTEEENAARKRQQQKRRLPQTGQGSPARIIGTPRKAKHRGGHEGFGVPVK